MEEYVFCFMHQLLAFMEAQCKLRCKVSGAYCKIQYNGKEIRMYTFDKFQQPEEVKTFHPRKITGNHGDSDRGLMDGFSKSMEAVVNSDRGVEQG